VAYPERPSPNPVDWENVPTNELPTSISRRGQRKKQKRFLKGPIPLSLLQNATKLPGAALPVYLMARHRADLTGSETVTLPNAYLKDWGISPDRCRRALNALTTENLIFIQRINGRSTKVTLL
jgi:hypothetical protein